MRITRFVVALASLLTASALSAAEVKELNFGIIATEKAGALRQMWEPFLDLKQA
jgi:ABC-type phosphate/phosphonate transport system substrate-binding protein